MTGPGKETAGGPGGRDLVVCIHGLGRSSIVFWRLRPWLRRAGFDPLVYNYPSRECTVPQSIATFRDWLSGLDHGGRKVHFVGHSLGGILVRGALLEPVSLRVGRLVMIGTPNHGAGFLSLAGEQRWARWFFGPAAHDLEQGSPFITALGVPENVEIGVIAGTAPFFVGNPAAWFNHVFAPDVPHDGTVEVENTRLEGMQDFVALPSNHTLLCQNRTVMECTIRFLGSGRFREDGEPAGEAVA